MSMSKKFELTSNFKVSLGRKLFQIKALVSFGDVKEGDLGGYIEKEENLSHNGNAWVYGNARRSTAMRGSPVTRITQPSRGSELNSGQLHFLDVKMGQSA